MPFPCRFLTVSTIHLFEPLSIVCNPGRRKKIEQPCLAIPHYYSVCTCYPAEMLADCMYQWATNGNRSLPKQEKPRKCSHFPSLVPKPCQSLTNLLFTAPERAIPLGANLPGVPPNRKLANSSARLRKSPIRDWRAKQNWSYKLAKVSPLSS